MRAKSVDHQMGLKIIVALRHGPKHFVEIERAIFSRNPPQQSRILKKLERDGLLTRTVLRVGPPASTIYTLTDLGKSLAESSLPLINWLGEHRNDLSYARERARADQEAERARDIQAAAAGAGAL
jgi:DNA-binding HxlR family transcriptional regulator